jgi:ubiquinone/menaquinone biosynthesis C-methylase UbiE
MKPGSEAPDRERRYYRWFYEHIFSHCYDPGVRLFLSHFGGEGYFRKEMMSTAVFSGNCRVLDLCCGTGSLTMTIRQETGPLAQIIGVDESISQIEKAIKKNTFRNISFILGDASATCLPSDYFDIVFIGHALHEMSRSMILAVLGEAKRMMRNDGQLILLEFNRPAGLRRRWWLGFWLGSWIPYPLNFERRTLKDMFEYGVDGEVREAGFRDISKLVKFEGTMQVITAYK